MRWKGNWRVWTLADVAFLALLLTYLMERTQDSNPRTIRPGNRFATKAWRRREHNGVGRLVHTLADLARCFLHPHHPIRRHILQRLNRARGPPYLDRSGPVIAPQTEMHRPIA